MFSQWLPNHWVIVSSSFNRKLWYFPYHDDMLTCMVNTQVTMLTCKLIYAIILLRFHECNFSVVSRNTNLQLFFWSSSLKPFNLLFQDIPWALVWRLWHMGFLEEYLSSNFLLCCSNLKYIFPVCIDSSSSIIFQHHLSLLAIYHGSFHYLLRENKQKLT